MGDHQQTFAVSIARHLAPVQHPEIIERDGTFHWLWSSIYYSCECTALFSELRASHSESCFCTAEFVAPAQVLSSNVWPLSNKSRSVLVPRLAGAINIRQCSSSLQWLLEAYLLHGLGVRFEGKKCTVQGVDKGRLMNSVSTQHKTAHHLDAHVAHGNKSLFQKMQFGTQRTVSNNMTRFLKSESTYLAWCNQLSERENRYLASF